MNDQFGDWTEYLDAIEAQDGVRVIGVTDYLSIAGYSRLRAEKEAGRLKDIDLLIPNIEFRFSPPTDKATAINIHLLICPDDPDHEKKIGQALARLTWEYNKLPYSCLPDQLEALGKAFDPTIIDAKVALSKGVEQFKIDFTRFRDWFNDEHWLRQNTLVAVSAGDDGLSGFLKQGGWAAHREEITRFSDLLFSGRPGEREFWLGLGTPEDKKTVDHLGGSRACIHGSDAHELAKLFKPDLDRFCWIKADPTFEGLRQVLYEPGDRVHIGPSAPAYHDQARVIRSISLKKADGWFDEEDIPLNPGLVSIIGQKGSGKSALAEVAAFTAGTWETEEPSSFLRRAGQHLSDLAVTLNWADGHATAARLGAGQSGSREVRYLSQKFVERLCSEDHIGGELVREIENVVFTYIDPTDTLNASSFGELRALRTDGIRAEATHLQHDVARLIHEECAVRDNVAKLPDKRARIKTLTEEKDGLLKQMPKAASAEEAKLQNELQTRRAALGALQQVVAADKQRLQRIEDIRTRVTAFRAQIGRFGSDLAPLLEEAGIPATERGPFTPAFPADTEPPLAKRTAQLQTAIKTNQGATENPAENTIRWLEARIKELSEKDSADKARQQRIRVIQTRVAAIGSEVERLQAEIAQIEGPGKERMVAAHAERLTAYVGYFKNLKREQETLEQLYGPVKKHLASAAAAPSEQELEFSIRWHADIDAWLERGTVLFDQRRTIPYGTFADLARAARTHLVPAWEAGIADSIGPALETFLAEFKKNDPPARDYLRSGITVEQLLLWLYDVQHISLQYGLKYNGVELEKLSPGTKGIVLLILYLGMDVGDTRPLIVDQPDENLDNESIFQLLTTYFRTAKARRQILLITHNPNLVVNADSEQVVVARCERRANGLPYIRYGSGSLEDDRPPDQGIKQQVCRILEGGRDAFRRRERRYDLSK